MRVHLTGNSADDLRPVLERLGIAVAAAPEAADILITYGGDGTLIGAEARWPGVPKLPMRDDRTCQKCERHTNERVLQRLVEGRLATSDLIKLEARVGDAVLHGMNDILMRNQDIRSAVRFIVLVNDERVTDEMIGDGLVASTPFGSSAYFRSITTTTFRAGIGIAFNNCTEFLNHLVLREDDEVRVSVVRGPAQLTADNIDKVIDLEAGDDLFIRRSEESATVLAVDDMRCSMCRYTHAPRRRF